MKLTLSIAVILLCSVIDAMGQGEPVGIGNALKEDTAEKKSFNLLQLNPGVDYLNRHSKTDFPTLVDRSPSGLSKDDLRVSRQPDFLQYNLSNDSFGVYNSGRLSLSPFSYHASNYFEGADFVGYQGTFKVSDRISLNMSTYFSSGYFGYLVPRRIENASLSLGISVNLTDRISLYGWGMTSVNSGINPAYMPMMGAAKGFGVGAVYKINESIFLQGGYQRSYYKGKWHDSYYVLPGFKWKIP